eukprot:9470859-Pyramimonas_sp.AAC.1
MQGWVLFQEATLPVVRWELMPLLIGSHDVEGRHLVSQEVTYPGGALLGDRTTCAKKLGQPRYWLWLSSDACGH